MTEPLRYATSQALLAAAKAKATDQAVRNHQSIQQVLRQFVYDRLLARLFHDPDAPWVLKGGNALMSREPIAARASLDLDLAARQARENLDSMVKKFEDATALDLDDFFRFGITRRREHQGGTQPNVAGYRLTIEAYCGTKLVETVTIDLVTGTLITGSPDLLTRSSLPIDGLAPVVVTVYPIVDHVADKLCATAETHGIVGRASTRVRDLVDLVVIANTQVVDADELTRAIDLEWAHRRLPGEPAFDPPGAWAPSYPRLARTTPGCARHPTFEAATAFVGKEFVGPILARQTAGTTWSPSAGSWRRD